MRKFLFLAITSIALLGIVGGIQYSNAHKYTNDESATFIATVERIRAELDFIESNPTDENAAKHAELASGLLDRTTIKELTERNERVGTDLPASLKDLRGTLESGSEEDLSKKIKGLDDLLEEALFVRVEKQQINNSTVKALSFALVVNSMLDHYYKAVPDKGDDTSTKSSELIKTTDGGKYNVAVSWSPPTITAGTTNTYFIEFFDAESEEKLSTMRYAFMFMPQSDPETMIIHRAGQKMTDGNATQTFTFKETRVGPNTLRISELNGGEEFVDFDIDVLPPSEAGDSTASGTISSLIDYQSAQSLTNRIQDLFSELQQQSSLDPSVTADLKNSVKKLKSTVDSEAPSSEVELIVHSEIHPKLMEIYNLKIIPEFPAGLIMAMVAPFVFLLVLKKFHRQSNRLVSN